MSGVSQSTAREGRISAAYEPRSGVHDGERSNPSGVQRRELTLVAKDGYPLAATLHSLDPDTSPALGTVIINSATAVPQSYYRRYATFLAQAGLRVLTYDYRGIGGSRPERLAGFDATMTDWAKLDARAAFELVARRFEREPLAFVGHSFGGQLVALLDEARAAQGSVMVGSQLGYFGHWPMNERARLVLYWYGLVPALTRALGYMPGRVGLGVDLPAGVAREWARWCRSPAYLFDWHADARERIAKFDRPTLLYSFTDDDYAPAAATEHLIAELRNAQLSHRRLSPGQLGAKRVGHFGFFRPQFEQTLWRESRDYLLDVALGRTPRVVPRSRPDLWRFDFTSDVLADLEYGR